MTTDFDIVFSELVLGGNEWYVLSFYKFKMKKLAGILCRRKTLTCAVVE